MAAPLQTTIRLIACLLLTGLTTAKATTFCVSTGTQLANALSTAAANGQNDEIRITNGTLKGTTSVANNPRWAYQPAESDEATSLNISGGWSTGNSCASQTIGILRTTLDAELLGANVQIRPLTPSYSGQVNLRNLTLARGRSFSAGNASGIQAIFTGTISAQLLIENVLVTSSQSTVSSAPGVLIDIYGGGVARFRNNVVSNNFAFGANSGAGVEIRGLDNAIAYVSNNSIFSNYGTSLAGYGLGIDGVVTASNNVVADNVTSAVGSTYQVYATTGSGITLRNNHFEDVRITGGAFSELGTTIGDPMWTGIGSVQVPNEVSPLRDSGVNNPPGGIAGTDIEGFPRIMNSTVDRGATEAPAVAITDRIFQSGFEN